VSATDKKYAVAWALGLNKWFLIFNLSGQILHVNWVVDCVQQWCLRFLSWVIDLPPVFLFPDNSLLDVTRVICWNSHAELTNIITHQPSLHHQWKNNGEFAVNKRKMSDSLWNQNTEHEKKEKEKHCMVLTEMVFSVVILLDQKGQWKVLLQTCRIVRMIHIHQPFFCCHSMELELWVCGLGRSNCLA